LSDRPTDAFFGKSVNVFHASQTFSVIGRFYRKLPGSILDDRALPRPRRVD
jgi:hypothetical protein